MPRFVGQYLWAYLPDTSDVERRRIAAVYLVLGHHSNGGDGCVFADEVADAEDQGTDAGVEQPSGADALLELGRRKFDLLILDINIPTLSGLKVFEIMVQKQIHTPALFITGIQGIEVETQSLEMGAAGFLRKPIRKEVLLPKVRGILKRSGRHRVASE